MKKRYIRHASELVTCRGKAPKFGKEMADIGLIRDGGVLIHGDKIVETGTTEELDQKINMEEYEVLDASGKTVLPGFVDSHTHFIFGDIFLHDVRSYRERQLAPHGIEVVEPLWNQSSQEVIADFLATGLQTVVVTTMADGLGADAIGRKITPEFISSFPASVDPNGENGEYHTLCYDGPLFRHPVAFRLGEPFLFSHEVGMADGSRQTFSYWFAAIR